MSKSHVDQAKSHVDQAVESIERSLGELQPYLDEYERLTKALVGLTGEPRRSYVRRPVGVRLDQLIQLIPNGGTRRIVDLARDMNLSVPRVVQLVNSLEESGRVTRSQEGVKVNEPLP